MGALAVLAALYAATAHGPRAARRPGAAGGGREPPRPDAARARAVDGGASRAGRERVAGGAGRAARHLPVRRRRSLDRDHRLHRRRVARPRRVDGAAGVGARPALRRRSPAGYAHAARARCTRRRSGRARWTRTSRRLAPAGERRRRPGSSPTRAGRVRARSGARRARATSPTSRRRKAARSGSTARRSCCRRRRPRVRGPGPLLGEHTDDVLARSCSYDDERIATRSAATASSRRAGLPAPRDLDGAPGRRTASERGLRRRARAGSLHARAAQRR